MQKDETEDMSSRIIHTILALGVLIAFTGCKEPDFKAQNRALTERVATLSAENLDLISEADALEGKLEHLSAETERLEAERNALAIELKALKSKNSRKRRRR